MDRGDLYFTGINDRSRIIEIDFDLLQGVYPEYQRKKRLCCGRKTQILFVH
jgi:hypothetical protein